MSAFRHTIPEAPVHALLRPRLLARVATRWEYPVVLLEAGAGFGKTTLLAQAMCENTLAPRGTDVWFTCARADATAPVLAADLLSAVGGTGSGAGAEAIVDAIWERSPVPVALVLDDVDAIPHDSPGAALLREVVEMLPANGHLVLASRGKPPVPMSRMLAQGHAVRIGAEELRYTPEELDALSKLRGVSTEKLRAFDGWPALTELVISVGASASERFLWEEVLDRLPAERRRAFASLVAVGGGDAEVVSAAADTHVNPIELVEDIPLVAIGVDGSCRPHALWEKALANELDPRQVRSARRRAAGVLHARGDLVGAVELLALTDDWPAVRSLVIEACLRGRSFVVDGLLERWLSLLPDAEEDPVRILLQGALDRVARRHDAAHQRFTEAAERFRTEGNGEGELAALANLGFMARRLGDTGTLIACLGHMTQLEEQGVSSAGLFTAIGRAVVARAAGDVEGSWAELETIPHDVLNPEWAVAVDSLRVGALIMLGRCEEAIAIADRDRGDPRPEGSQMDGHLARWFAGRAGDCLAVETFPGADDDSPYDRFLSAVMTIFCRAHTGRGAEARRALDRMRADSGSIEGHLRTVTLGVCSALVALAEGDEEGAEATVSALLEELPLEEGTVEQTYRRVFPVLYVLAPQTRELWDRMTLGPSWSQSRDIACELCRVRAGEMPSPLGVAPGKVLTTLPLPWAMELGVAMKAAGHREGDELICWLLEHLGGRARPTLRSLAGRDEGPVARAARRALATSPAAPSSVLRVRVLGPSVLERDGVPVDDPDWQRERVRLLLLYLIAKQRASREEIAAALWPDLDERKAASNLRVNLNHLQRILEPDREPGDAPYYIRQTGDALTLVEDGHLQVDAWELDELIDAGMEADRMSSPSVALDAFREAAALWQGEYLQDARYEEWAAGPRRRLHMRLVAAVVRAAELLVAAGSPHEAIELAERALEGEPWSESAYRVIAKAHLVGGRRELARRALADCREMLADLAADPEPETLMLERRVASGGSTSPL